MEDNPYTKLAGMMSTTASGNGLRLRVGSVTAVNPVQLSVGGIMVDGNMLRWNAALLTQQRTIKSPTGQLSISASCPNGNHSSASVLGGTLTETLESPILPGDSVLTITEDDQIFFVLCKLE